LAPLTSLGLVSSHTNLLAMGQRRYAIKPGDSPVRNLLFTLSRRSAAHAFEILRAQAELS
jgi:hypothetical protein